MGQQIGFFGAIELGDGLQTVSPRLERGAAAVVPVFGAQQPVLPTDSPNWVHTLEAVFDKDESGSGPVGQWNLHDWLDTVRVALLATVTAAIGWIGDKLKTSDVTVGGAQGLNVTITVTDLPSLGLSVGDLVYFDSGGWGVVNVVGGGPPHTFRLAELFDVDVAIADNAYRAWRVYPSCRPRVFDPGVPESGSMDGFRHGIRLRVDTTGAPLKSTAP